MRYEAQSFTIPVDVSSAVVDPAGSMGVVYSLFHQEHRRLFGHANPNAPVAIDDLRLRTIGRQPKPAAKDPTRHTTNSSIAQVSPAERRTLRLAGRSCENAAVFDWGQLPRHWSHAGPAVIQQDLATILVPDGFRARMGAFGDVELLKEA
jgi:N-methylhydantoinase A